MLLATKEIEIGGFKLMKRRLLGTLLVLCIVISLLPAGYVNVMAASAYSAGSAAGTSSSPLTYTISNETQLRALATTVNSGTSYQNTTFILQNNITLGATVWTPIGISYTSSFGGVFDGAGYTISGLKDTGLFGFMNGYASKIENVGLLNVNITSGVAFNGYNVGGILSYNNNGTVQNCYVTGTLTGNLNVQYGGYLGGIVGWNQGGTVQNCYSTATITTTDPNTSTSPPCWGGIVGYNSNGTLQNCYFAGSVTDNYSGSSKTKYVGGIVADFYTNQPGAVKNCYWRSGATSLGIGRNYDSTAYYYTNNYVNIAPFNNTSGGTFLNACNVNGDNNSYTGTSLREALNASVNASQNTSLKTWTSSGSYPIFSALWVPPTHTATLTINKDGSPWSDSGKSFALYQSNIKKYDLALSGNVLTASALAGTYDIYEGLTDTGVDIEVSSGGANSAALNYYTVTFKNEDQTSILDTQIVLSGRTATYGGATPTKEATPKFTYYFDRWVTTPGDYGDNLSSITTQKTVFASFAFYIRTYTITWKENAFKTIDTSTVSYDVMPNHSTPTLDGYTFLGWQPSLARVTVDTSYMATWKAITPASAPDASIVTERTTDTITISTQTGYEYSVNGTNWYSSTSGSCTFNGLTPGATYNLVCRKAAVTTGGLVAAASDPSPALSIKTKYAPSLSVSAATTSVAYPANTTLTATLTNADSISGKTIKFYNAATLLGTSTTDTTGRATLPIISPAVGSHSYHAVYDGDTSNNSTSTSAINFTVSKGSQMVSFANTNDINKTYGEPSFNLPDVLGGAGIGILSYRSDNENVATVSGGNVTITGAGEAIIYVKKLGDASYNDSAEASLKVKVFPATIIVTPDNGQSKYYGQDDPILSFSSFGAIEGEIPVFTGALGRATGDAIANNYAINQGTLALTNNGVFLAQNYRLVFSTNPVKFEIKEYSTSAEATASPNGENGWFKAAPITLNAPAGYLISTNNSLTGNTWSSSINLNDADGAYSSATYYLKSISANANAISTSKSYNYKVDKTVPAIVSVTGNPDSWQESDVTLRLIANDSVSGLAVTAYSFDGGISWQVNNEKVYGVNQTIHANTLQVRDAAGNVQKYASEIIISKIDRTNPSAPEIKLDSNSPNTLWYNAYPTIGITPPLHAAGTAPETTYYKLWNTSALNNNVEPLNGIVLSDDTQALINGDGIWQLKTWTEDAAGNKSEENQIEIKVDITAADGDIKINENSVKTFLNTITFGLFFNRNIDVSITAADETSGISKIEYYRDTEILDQKTLEDTVSWTEYAGTLSETVVDAKRFIYYAKITDNSSNVTYFASNGATFDTTKPSITGITNNAVYYVDQAVTATDINPDTLTLNGSTFTSGEKLTGNIIATYVIAATDKAGNNTTATVTMRPISSLSTAIDKLDVNNVRSSDKAEVRTVLVSVEAALLTTGNGASQAQINGLNALIDKCNGLLDQIAEIQQARLNAYNPVKDITTNNIVKTDRVILKHALDSLQTILKFNSSNLTAAEIQTIQGQIRSICILIETLDEVTELEQLITELPDPIKVEKSDIDSITLANNANEALTVYQKGLVDGELKTKLVEVIGALRKALLLDVPTSTRLEAIGDTSFDFKTELVVTPVLDKIDTNMIQKFNVGVRAIANGQEIVQLYDIKLMLNGKTIQPNGQAKVTLTLKDEQEQYTNLQIVYVADDGTSTIIPSTVNGNEISFITDHFSYYAIVGTAGSKAAPIPKTGETRTALPIVGIVLLSVSILIAYKKRRYGSSSYF